MRRRTKEKPFKIALYATIKGFTDRKDLASWKLSIQVGLPAVIAEHFGVDPGNVEVGVEEISVVHLGE